MEDLKTLLFTLYSNNKTKEECKNLEFEINKMVYDCKVQRIKELMRSKKNGF